jgi:trimeric autotransporter adhesin
MSYEGPHPLPIKSGGTDAASFTAYGPVVAGSTSTSALASVSPSATSGVPFISQGASANPTFGVATVPGGGTGNFAFTAYTVLCAGTTTTGTFQNVVSVGTSGQVLTSNGASALPTFQAAGASSITITGDSGGGLTGNSFTFTGGTTGLTFSGATTTETLTGTLIVGNGGTGQSTLAAYRLITGGTTSTGALQTVASTGSAGQLLTSGGSAAVPAWTTATYPSTITANDLVYASASNVIGGLASANSSILSTNSSGVPTWTTAPNITALTIDNGAGNNDVISLAQAGTTKTIFGYSNSSTAFLLCNGAVFSGSTAAIIVDANGGQWLGHQNNSAPSAGYIGEQIRATLAQGSAATLSNGSNANVCSISLTAGIWDCSGIAGFTGYTTGTGVQLSISTSSVTSGTAGDNFVALAATSLTGSDTYISIPSYRIPVATSQTVYLVGLANFTAGTAKVYGRLSATRVG